MKVASFLENIKYNIDKPAISIVLETSCSKEIRIIFKKGQIMKDHKAPFAIVVQVIKGSINFGTNEESIELNQGDLISLKANVIHNLTAIENSVVRLTLSKLDTVDRVKNV